MKGIRVEISPSRSLARHNVLIVASDSMSDNLYYIGRRWLNRCAAALSTGLLSIFWRIADRACEVKTTHNPVTPMTYVTM
jgi:hypothetical protein